MGQLVDVLETELPFELTAQADYLRVGFQAMGGPCELLIDSVDKNLGREIAALCYLEVKRIETKYSRYRQDNICFSINNAKGKAVQIDDETYRLLSFAEECYRVSGGLFDLSSGVLRRVWHFDGSDKLPSQSAIDTLLPLIGWKKITFNQQIVQLPENMEIDFGGIGKEYAVSRCAELCQKNFSDISVLVNLGGDLQISQPRVGNKPWLVGIENSKQVIPLLQGALATSGDSKRFLEKEGIRYSHILNPKTGWPVADAPPSVTVIASLCVQAGLLATLALLQGGEAEGFLRAQEVEYWI